MRCFERILCDNFPTFSCEDLLLSAFIVLLLLLLLLRLLLLLAWQLHCGCATGRLGRLAAARTSKHCATHDALGLAVFAAHAVRQHTLCAAERRLTVTPFGAC